MLRDMIEKDANPYGKQSEKLKDGEAMDINEMWEILETEPTRDKREIKRAYARAVKKYHPEENQEAFQKVYAAYKQAVELAGKPENVFFHSQEEQTITEEQQGEEIFRFEIHIEPNQEWQQEKHKEQQQEPEEEKPEEEQRIQNLFLEMKEKREEKLFIFRHKWHWYLTNQKKDGAQREMQAYIQTRWFRDIMEEPAVVSQLTAGFDKYCRGKSGALKEDVWQVYELEKYFSGNGQERYFNLFQVLKTDPERFRVRMEKEAEKRREIVYARLEEENRLTGNFMKMVLFMAVNFLLMALMVATGMFTEKNKGKVDFDKEKEKILSYLQENYPMAEFYLPEMSTEEPEEKYAGENEDGRNYIVKTADSDITVHVYTEERKGKIFIGEDFGRQYMQKLADKWGLACDLCRVEEPWSDGKTHNLLLGEYHMEPEFEKLEGGLKEYMKRFREFAGSEEVGEFVNIDGVSFCVSNCFCPKAFIMEAGGVPKPLLYDLEELPEPEVMAEEMAECITDYYIHMEPWQLENYPSYSQWVSSYEEKIKKMDKKHSTPGGNSVAGLAKELGVQVVFYQRGDSEYISLGDLYRIAKKSDYPPVVIEDGSGFVWKNQIRCSYDGEGNDGAFACRFIVEMFMEE